MTQQAPDRAIMGVRSASLSALVERIPEGWTRAIYNGRTYGLARTTRADGKSTTIFAEELGGTDLISANVYLTVAAEHLRACEMPAAKVLAFLRAWTPA
ncbi:MULTISPECIES: peptide methionine sulfoxide reductase [Mycobacteroides]|uniref:peptide methionine sulfoxide reductase n=1 Tax=Mycobacteroides TaxID=670516 RepID=UPI000A7CFF45|nr:MULTISPECIES: peptide methionine sulfoxide reductase [Mycobacteroides]